MGRSADRKSSQAGANPAWPATQVGLWTAARMYLQGDYGVDSVAMLSSAVHGDSCIGPRS